MMPARNRGGTLCVSFSRQSTGEIRFWVSAMKNSKIDFRYLALAIDPCFVGLFDDYPGVIEYHKESPQLTAQVVIESLTMLVSRYEKLVFLDFTSIILENNFSAKAIKKIVKFSEELTKNTSVMFFDPMGVLEKDKNLHRNRVRTSESNANDFMERYIKDVGATTQFRAYYFGRYLKARAVSQLVVLPGQIEIIRSVPYNCIIEPTCDHIHYFSCEFERIKRDELPNNRKVLIALSDFVSKSVSKKLINDLISYSISQLVNVVGFESIVVIDPMGLELDNFMSENIDFRVHRRMARSEFLEEMRSVGLCVTFVPTSTVGVTAVQNDVPFVSLYSSKQSYSFIEKHNPQDFVPKFTSLGIWEDIAFLENLKSANNSYIGSINMLDISTDEGFECLRDGLSHLALDYNEIMSEIADSLKPIEKLLI